MNKRVIQGAVILAVIILVGIVFIDKRSSKGSLYDMQQSIDENAHSMQDDRKPFEITGFTPDMIKENGKPMIIVMGEDWCQPCLRMIPDLTELSRTIDDVDIRYMDLEENRAAFEYFPIRVTPTIAVYNGDGTPFTPPEDSSIDYILYTYRDTGGSAFTIHEGYLDRSQLEMMIEDLRSAQ